MERSSVRKVALLFGLVVVAAGAEWVDNNSDYQRSKVLQSGNRREVMAKASFGSDAIYSHLMGAEIAGQHFTVPISNESFRNGARGAGALDNNATPSSIWGEVSGPSQRNGAASPGSLQGAAAGSPLDISTGDNF